MPQGTEVNRESEVTFRVITGIYYQHSKFSWRNLSRVNLEFKITIFQI